jgi:hypothetical protein
VPKRGGHDGGAGDQALFHVNVDAGELAVESNSNANQSWSN